MHFIIYTPLYVTLFWAVVFLSEFNLRNRARHALGFFMFIAATIYFCHSFFFKGDFDTYLMLDPLYTGASLMVYPMYYVYSKHLTSEVYYRWFNIWHFVPGLFFLGLMIVVYLASSLEERNIYLHNTLFDNRFLSVLDGGNNGWLARLHYTARIIYVAQVFYYGIKAYKAVSRHHEYLANYYSNIEGRKLRWITMLTLVLMIISILVVIANIVGRGSFYSHREMLYATSIFFSLLLFVVGLLGNRQESILYELHSDETAQSASYATFNPGHSGMLRHILREKLSTLMKEEELFLLPELTINMVCTKLNTSRRLLSVLIQEEYGEDFHFFVNRHRIGYAKTYLKSEEWREDLSSQIIASRTGFVSEKTFMKTFKKIEGVEFSAYMKLQRLRAFSRS